MSKLDVSILGFFKLQIVEKNKHSASPHLSPPNDPSAQHEGKNWISCMMMTAVVYPWSTFAIAFVLNTIAIFYQSLAAVPFGSMVVLVLLWGFLALPMCMMGSIAGKNLGGTVQLPCRYVEQFGFWGAREEIATKIGGISDPEGKCVVVTIGPLCVFVYRVKRIPSPIPSRAWYFAPAFIVMVGGLLPFGSIFIEMYFIFTSFWNYKVSNCNWVVQNRCRTATTACPRLCIFFRIRL